MWTQPPAAEDLKVEFSHLSAEMQPVIGRVEWKKKSSLTLAVRIRQASRVNSIKVQMPASASGSVSRGNESNTCVIGASKLTAVYSSRQKLESQDFELMVSDMECIITKMRFSGSSSGI